MNGVWCQWALKCTINFPKIHGWDRKNYYVYVDDIIIFGITEENHDMGYQKVMKKLKENNLVIKFLWMINYYRKLVTRCSKIAGSLYELLKKESDFKWEEEQKLPLVV